MQFIIDVRQASLSKPTVITIGNFDGLHLGHQALLRRLHQHAETIKPDGALTALLTFDPHPLVVLRPELAPQLLTTPRERLEFAANFGVDVGIIQPFTSEFSKLSASDFIRLLKKHLNLAGLVVGPDFALGRNRSGDLAALRELGEELDFSVVVLDPIALGDQIVRSSSIRSFLLEGNVSAAAEQLGRRYHATGYVVEGDRRGRQIGVPTANLQTPANKLLPVNGVYATYTQLNDRFGAPTFRSVTNLGVRPTVDGLRYRVETHLLDFPTPGVTGDLYSQSVTIEFVERLRGEQRFSSLQALVDQIHLDIAQARRLFGEAVPV